MSSKKRNTTQPLVVLGSTKMVRHTTTVSDPGPIQIAFILTQIAAVSQHYESVPATILLLAIPVSCPHKIQ